MWRKWWEVCNVNKLKQKEVVVRENKCETKTNCQTNQYVKKGIASIEKPIRRFTNNVAFSFTLFCSYEIIKVGFISEAVKWFQSPQSSRARRNWCRS